MCHLVSRPLIITDDDKGDDDEEVTSSADESESSARKSDDDNGDLFCNEQKVVHNNENEQLSCRLPMSNASIPTPAHIWSLELDLTHLKLFPN